MKNVAGNELLQQVIRLPVAQLFERAPQLLRLVDLADAQRRGLRARLQQPGPGLAFM